MVPTKYPTPRGMVRILSSAFGISIQDLGRRGLRSIGVPSSGAMDLYSARLANRLLNNDEKAAVLEITMGGGQLQFESDCTICLTGADFSAKINHEKAPLNSVLYLKKDSVLSFGKWRYGVRTYLAVRKGFQTELVLGSRSLYSGITSVSLIRKGTQLPIVADPGVPHQATASVKVNQAHFHSKTIACHAGPEFVSLSDAQKDRLVSAHFTISSHNSRMGYQLEELIENHLPSMLTSAVLPGTVQLTPSGKLIVLMRDCQVTGGYPRVLQLTENAISRLGQKTTGHKVQFVIK